MLSVRWTLNSLTSFPPLILVLILAQPSIPLLISWLPPIIAPTHKLNLKYHSLQTRSCVFPTYVFCYPNSSKASRTGRTSRSWDGGGEEAEEPQILSESLLFLLSCSFHPSLFSWYSLLPESLSFLSRPPPFSFSPTGGLPLVSLALQGRWLLGYEVLLWGCRVTLQSPDGDSVPVPKGGGMLYPGFFPCSSGRDGFSVGHFHYKLSSGLPCGCQPVLGLQLYQLDLVQLIIYCREMGVKWARRHILCEPWDTSDSNLCNLSGKSLKLSEF